MVFLFYFSVFLVIYTYLLYPLVLLLFYKKKRPDSHFFTSVTVIIPAYNEMPVISEKILNTISVCKNLTAQIILVSNGSDDGTELFQHPAITHIHTKDRKGKPEAINAALQIATGDIIVFTDANTVLTGGAIDKLLNHFDNPKVGLVCGEKSFSKKRMEVLAETIYWKLESGLKKLESAFYSVVGAAGELFAVRKELIKPLPENIILDDFYISMQVCRQGFTIAYEQEAKASEQPSQSLKDEYRRRVRIASGVMQWLITYGTDDFRNYRGKLKWLFFSHRICRWIIAPAALLLILGCAVFLGFQNNCYHFVFALVLLFAFMGFLLHTRNIHFPVFYFPFYFIMVHVCLLTGYIKFFRGRHTVLWNKAKRA